MISTLHVVFGGGIGGMESVSADLVEELQDKMGEQGVLLLSPVSGPLPERLLGIRGVTLISHPHQGKVDLYRTVRSLCRDHAVTAVVIYMFGLHVWIAAAARRAGVSRIITCVGNPPPTRFLPRAATAALAHLARPFSDLEVACSNYVRDAMIARYRLPESRVVMIHNWCRTEAIAAAQGRVGDEPPRIGMVARLDRIKDHDTVIRALGLLIAEHPTASLLLAGDGPRRAELELLVQEIGIDASVDILGSVTDVPGFLRDLTVFAYATTADEGFGVALIEAMAAGLPIVATEVGPVREVVDDVALLVPPSDPRSFSQALDRLLRDGDLRASLGAKAKARASLFDVGRAATRFTELLAPRK